MQLGCPKCPWTFGCPKELISHYKKHHQNADGPTEIEADTTKQVEKNAEEMEQETATSVEKSQEVEWMQRYNDLYYELYLEYIDGNEDEIDFINKGDVHDETLLFMATEDLT